MHRPLEIRRSRRVRHLAGISSNRRRSAASGWLELHSTECKPRSLGANQSLICVCIIYKEVTAKQRVNNFPMLENAWLAPSSIDFCPLMPVSLVPAHCWMGAQWGVDAWVAQERHKVQRLPSESTTVWPDRKSVLWSQFPKFQHFLNSVLKQGATSQALLHSTRNITHLNQAKSHGEQTSPSMSSTLLKHTFRRALVDLVVPYIVCSHWDANTTTKH